MAFRPAAAIGAVLVLGIGGWLVGRSMLDSAADAKRRDELLASAQQALINGAEAVLDRAGTPGADAAVRDEAEFYAAAARLSRYLETKERGDLNLARGVITRAAAGGAHASYAHLLLGRALAIDGAQRDPQQALTHLEAGLANPPKDEVVDLEKARALADQLRQELAGAGAGG